MKDLLTVTVMTPKQILYQGPALAVSSKNSEGKFDILAFHANFISIIENELITVLTDKKEQIEFKFAQAIIVNSDNKLTVFAEPTS